MTDVERDVTAFFDKFLLPRRTSPGWPQKDFLELRLGHMQEELFELEDAVDAHDVAGAADALIDLVYVAVGTCVAMGVPFGEVWRVVHEANMRKQRASADGSDSKRSSGFDVVKPEGWTAPDVASAVYGPDYWRNR